MNYLDLVYGASGTAIVREENAVAADCTLLPEPTRISTHRARKAYGRDVPLGYHVHHLCGNSWCANSEHLIAVSSDDHRKIHGRKSFCG